MGPRIKLAGEYILSLSLSLRAVPRKCSWVGIKTIILHGRKAVRSARLSKGGTYNKNREVRYPIRKSKMSVVIGASCNEQALGGSEFLSIIGENLFRKEVGDLPYLSILFCICPVIHFDM